MGSYSLGKQLYFGGTLRFVWVVWCFDFGNEAEGEELWLHFISQCLPRARRAAVTLFLAPVLSLSFLPHVTTHAWCIHGMLHICSPFLACIYLITPVFYGLKFKKWLRWVFLCVSHFASWIGLGNTYILVNILKFCNFHQ